MIPQAAIYFYRGNTTRRVSPISISILNDKRDNLTYEEQKILKIKKHHLKVYEDIFKVYSAKAKNKMENNAKSFTNFITDEELELPDFR